MAGRKRNHEKDLRVLELREVDGLSFRNIAAHPEIQEDVKNVHMRYKAMLSLKEDLSTG